MENFAELGYAGLFLAAFLAATLLPLSSEAVLSLLLVAGLQPVLLLSIATLGNVLGSLTNYYIGRWLAEKPGAIDETRKHSLTKSQQRFQRYGVLSLCFAWVPIIGDPLTVAAGYFRVPLHWFIILVTVGKFARYLAVMFVATEIV